MTRSDATKTIYLDEYHFRPLVISPGALEQITAIAMQNRVCKVCAEAYTQERPQVAQNTCLPCFLQSHAATRENHLTYLGEAGLDYNKRDMQHAFTDAAGYVFIVDSGTEYQTLERGTAKITVKIVSIQKGIST